MQHKRPILVPGMLGVLSFGTIICFLCGAWLADTRAVSACTRRFTTARTLPGILPMPIHRVWNNISSAWECWFKFDLIWRSWVNQSSHVEHGSPFSSSPRLQRYYPVCRRTPYGGARLRFTCRDAFSVRRRLQVTSVI
ncbi:hypothetical protein BJX66DRAFT_245873 [Aspergillus keveii]|uniref:Secreted protein n=1 Tax=Aspergillus keveii TaxID=714993 RepID=A0ABR4G1L0_9EURO